MIFSAFVEVIYIAVLRVIYFNMCMWLLEGSLYYQNVEKQNMYRTTWNKYQKYSQMECRHTRMLTKWDDRSKILDELVCVFSPFIISNNKRVELKIQTRSTYFIWIDSLAKLFAIEKFFEQTLDFRNTGRTTWKKNT